MRKQMGENVGKMKARPSCYRTRRNDFRGSETQTGADSRSCCFIRENPRRSAFFYRLLRFFSFFRFGSGHVRTVSAAGGAARYG